MLTQLQSLSFFGLLIWVIRKRKRCLILILFLILILNFILIIILIVAIVPSLMIPVFGWMAVKYLVNYPRFSCFSHPFNQSKG